MGNHNASIVDEWRTPMRLELLKCWARDFSLTEVAQKIGVSIQTLKAWRDRYPDIEEAIREGKEIIDYRVENALLKRALGYTTTDVKTIISPPDKNGNRAIRVEKTEKEIPPDTVAIMAWLNNRKPDQWKRNRDNVYQTKDDDSKITVNIIRHTKDEEKDEEWNVSTTKSAKKASTKKEIPEEQDLDYWPDDWDDE